MKTALWWLRVAKMNKRILCLFVFILTPHLSSKGEFDNILIEKLNDEFNTVDGFERLRDIYGNARDEYLKSDNIYNYMTEDFRYGIKIFDELKNNLNADYIISFVLYGGKLDKNGNEINTEITTKYVQNFFTKNKYNIYNLNDIYKAGKRLSFTVGGNLEVLNETNRILLDKSFDTSIRNENFPIIFGEFENIGGMNGRSGKGFFPLVYYNYFSMKNGNKVISEPERFKYKVANFVTPGDIDTYYYITLDDAINIIKGKNFLAENIN